MSRRSAAIALALLSLSFLPVPAQEGPPPPTGPHPGPGPMHLQFVLRSIDLTPDQDARVDALMKARHDVAESSRQAAEAARRALGEQVRAATFDEAAIRAKAAAVAPFDADRAVADAALLRDVRALLTSKQRETFDRELASVPPPPPFEPRPSR